MIEKIAKWLPEVTINGPVIYAVPRHKLGEKIERQFAEHGVKAKVFRGRGADDPEIPEQKMCQNLAAVELAQRCHENISETCCKRKTMKCRFYEQCGYQRQMRGEYPDVWVVAADILFHTQEIFGTPCAVIIDEALWVKGLRGIEQDRLVGRDRQPDQTAHVGYQFRHRSARLRPPLARSRLHKQEDDGGVDRRQLIENLFPPGDRGFLGTADHSPRVGVHTEGRAASRHVGRRHQAAGTRQHH